MLSAKDIQLLEKMFGKITENMVTKDMLRENNEVFGRQLKREMRDEIHAVVNGAVFASEARMMKRMDNLREEILDGVSDIVGDEIFPQIDDLEIRVLRLEQRVA